MDDAPLPITNGVANAIAKGVKQGVIPESRIQTPETTLSRTVGNATPSQQSETGIKSRATWRAILFRLRDALFRSN